MTSPQRLPTSLTPLDMALDALLGGLEPVAPMEVTPKEALRCIAAGTPPLPAHPPRDTAAVDGYAFCARDLVGASSYSPLPLTAPPIWVEAGEALPEASDCVLDSDSVDLSGPLPQVLAEAIPGQGVRRAGSDIAAGSLLVEAGRRVLPRDLLMARAAGIARLNVRRPRLRIVNVPGGSMTADLIAESAQATGAETVSFTAAGRDAGSIAAALDDGACDLLLIVGGSGVGRTDAAVTALAARGKILAHGIALQPGRTSAAGRIGNTPVVVLPGAPDQALAAWWTLALPAVDRLSGRALRKTVNLPLARKIASSIGIAEIVLLERKQDMWVPLAVGELSLDAIVRAEAWLTVPGGSEGFAAGSPLDAYILRD
ncbi:molybdopterin-binding protein [Bradyrhizobium valentinum]|uniref:Molybdopterin molybdenumtransferase n=1 Tax=Bradyrhizobium valentinum TaxID=1518501 RepID=A0A0R3LXR6_9BRAD|nr:molybdopterin-binding protein [Bradyrhizobium valentinum]KRR00196.1 molybdopterin-binding protein [Bradyrhizobium valentinum]KRR12753.1 molybdopterin-binding protein [Bradyrhizobium valentinum]